MTSSETLPTETSSPGSRCQTPPSDEILGRVSVRKLIAGSMSDRRHGSRIGGPLLDDAQVLDDLGDLSVAEHAVARHRTELTAGVGDTVADHVTDLGVAEPARAGTEQRRAERGAVEVVAVARRTIGPVGAFAALRRRL